MTYVTSSGGGPGEGVLGKAYRLRGVYGEALVNQGITVSVNTNTQTKTAAWGLPFEGDSVKLRQSA